MNSRRTPRLKPWTWLIALLFLGLALVFWAARAEGVSIGPSQLDSTQASWQVYDGSTIGQVLRIEPARLVGLRLWLGSTTEHVNGMLSAQLYSFEHKRDVAAATVPLNTLRAEQAFDIRFSKIDVENWPADVPLTVELRVSTEGVPESAPITFYGSNNRYANGSVVLDGEQRPSNDLAFATLYPGTWLDRFLPITTIAAFRPGIFGWPPLYGMLAWLVLWAAGVLCMRFVQLAL